MVDQVHASGSRLVSYGNPQCGIGKPEIYRRNYQDLPLRASAAPEGNGQSRASSGPETVVAARRETMAWLTKEMDPMLRPKGRADRESGALVPKLLGIINSSWVSQAVCVAAELGLADQLASGPKPVGELARATGCHAPSLRRLLRALVSLELCTERDDGAFALTPLGALLRADAPSSLRSWAIWWGRYLWPVWAQLRHSVESGRAARPLATGSKGFDHLGQDSASAAVFHRAMAELTRLVGREVVRAYDFSGMKQVADVGGGYGELLAAVLQAHPTLRGVLFDLAHAIHGAKPHLDRLGVGDRCELVSGSFFESVPAGADAYLLKSVIHDWDDEHCAVILRNCRRAMAPGGKLLLVEQLLPARLEATARHQAMARADLNMLVVHGAQERTEAEFRRLLCAHAFRLTRIIPAGVSFSVIEGIPA